MKIRVLFYRAARDGHPLDDAISMWTKLWNWGTEPYSHTEIWWPGKDDEGLVDWYAGECFTSTMRPPDKGTVIRDASRVLTHPSRWDFCEINVSADLLHSAMAMAWIYTAGNKGYDFACILGFFLPFRIRNKDKMICSEAVQAFLVWCGIFPDLKVWSPRRLSRKLTKLGLEIKPLVVGCQR